MILIVIVESKYDDEKVLKRNLLIYTFFGASGFAGYEVCNNLSDFCYFTFCS